MPPLKALVVSKKRFQDVSLTPIGPKIIQNVSFAPIGWTRITLNYSEKVNELRYFTEADFIFFMSWHAAKSIY